MTGDDDAATRWGANLALWGIPDDIVRAAPQSPWIHPVDSFRPSNAPPADTPSLRRAVEALDEVAAASPDARSVLDVGCGGGRSSLALADRIDLLIGVDRQAGMLEVLAAEAATRGLSCTTVLGSWPEAAATVPRCTIVVCHHVLFNVGDLVPFVAALNERALRRVIIEIPFHHPLANLAPAWKHFWNLDRPERPTALDAAEVVREMGLDVTVELFELADPKAGEPVSDRDVEHTRVRLCLPPSRDPEVRAFLDDLPRPPRVTATLWWDR